MNRCLKSALLKNFYLTKSLNFLIADLPTSNSRLLSSDPAIRPSNNKKDGLSKAVQTRNLARDSNRRPAKLVGRPVKNQKLQQFQHHKYDLSRLKMSGPQTIEDLIKRVNVKPLALTEDGDVGLEFCGTLDKSMFFRCWCKLLICSFTFLFNFKRGPNRSPFFVQTK
jgi:hypothetical protein